MKLYLCLSILFLSFLGYTQTTEITKKMNNSVYVTCDSTGTPILKNGKAYYFVFDSTGRVDFRTGADISEAVDSPVLYTGTWANIDKKVFWEWTETKRTGSAMFEEESTNLTTKNGTIYRLIGKY